MTKAQKLEPSPSLQKSLLDPHFLLANSEGVNYYRRVASRTAYGLNLPYEVHYDD